MATFIFTIVSGDGPTVTPISPLDGSSGVGPGAKIQLSVIDDLGAPLTGINVTVDGTPYVVAGVAVNGAVLESSPNLGNGFDIKVKLPAQLANGDHVVIASAADTSTNTTQITYTFTVGIGPRLIRVTNPQEGYLIAHFNKPMRHDAAFLATESYVVDPISEGALDLTITDVLISTANPDQAILRFIGGGSTYQLTVNSLSAADGSPLDLLYNSVLFEVDFGSLGDPTIKLFNSVFGPLGIAQRNIPRRIIDRLVANRATARALDEQLRIRLAAISNGTTGRDGRPGIDRQ